VTVFPPTLLPWAAPLFAPEDVCCIRVRVIGVAAHLAAEGHLRSCCFELARIDFNAPSGVEMVLVTPRSIPRLTPITVRSTFGRGNGNEMNQRPDLSRVTHSDFTSSILVPATVRRNFTQPSLGSLTSVHRLLILRVSNL
jgi:hypothetical protein